MDEETLAALRGSIKKWEDIVASRAIDKGKGNCPLCLMFFSDYCRGCPVEAKTNRDCCSGTPYTHWLDVEPEWYNDDGTYIHTEESLAAAKAELDFLRSLLPQEAAE